MQVEKVLTGIAGFDAITRGGLPRGRTTIVIGGLGSGKTVFALQSLVYALRELHESAILVAFEEKAQQILDNASTFGWGLEEYIAANRLTVLDARISPDTVHSGGFDLKGLLSALEARIAQTGATRVVFDGVSVLLALLNDPLAERQELYRIRDWLSDRQVTGIITARSGDDMPYAQESFIAFMADCLVRLELRIGDRVATRELRVVKYRGSSFAENAVPFVISPSGIQVARFDSMDLDFAVPTERVSTGIERLDMMLQGGYYRLSSTLITGAPGTAKTTLASAFVQAACRRGERALYVGFDEASAEIVRNVRSVGIDLQPFIDSGLLSIDSTRTEARSSEEHLLTTLQRMHEHRPTSLVVDPLSAITRAGGALNAYSVAQRLLYEAKRQGITVVFTSLLEGNEPEQEATPLAVSTIADTWMHLSYTVQAGERNRLITIVKSRGTAHSAQVRELILTSEGPTLADVYTAGGAVLVGTMRREREMEAQFALQRARAEDARRRAEIESEIAKARAGIEALQRELEVREAEMQLLETERLAAEAHQRAFQQMEERRRGVGGSSCEPQEEP